MYKFLGKKDVLYQLDPESINIKLNYKCEEGTVEAGSFKCGNTPEEAKKNYEEQQKGKQNPTKSKLSSSEIEKIQSKILLDLFDAEKENDQEKLKELRSQYLKLADLAKLAETELITPKEPITVYDKFSDTSVKLVDTMGERYKTALRIYVNGSVQLNSMLRSSKNDKFDESEKINNKDTIARLTKMFNKSKAPTDLIVYRGIDSNELDAIQKNVGEVFTSKSFTSTSHNIKVAQGFSKFYNNDDSIIMEIHVKKGTPAFSMDSFVQREYPYSKWMVGEDGKERSGGKQNEIIINRDQKYKIIGIEKSGKNRKVILETI